MNHRRIAHDVLAASLQFPNIELSNGPWASSALLALKTSTGRIYTLDVAFPDVYPNMPPEFRIRMPQLRRGAPHLYGDGRLCLMHPSRWNPGAHTLTYAIARAAKWLNKYEVWQATGRWPGRHHKH